MLRLDRAGLRMNGRWLVRHISLEAAPGTVTAIIGPNGSGKSTVLRLLVGLWKPTEGRVWVDGRDSVLLDRRQFASSVAFVAQNSRIDVPFTVWQVVSMGRHPHLGRFEAPGPRDYRAVETALQRAHVEHLAHRAVNELSGGEFQRVMIARCLAQEAVAIAMDEPTSNLDLNHSLDVCDLLRELAGEGRTVVVALHDLNAVARWADEVVLLDRGHLRAAGKARNVMADERLAAVFGVEIEHVRAPSGRDALLFSAGQRNGPDQARDRDGHRGG